MVTIARLPKETEAEIQRLIDSGRFENSTAVVVEAIHSLALHNDRVERERQLVEVGLEQAHRGELIDDSPDFRQALRSTARNLAASDAPLDPDVGGQAAASIHARGPGRLRDVTRILQSSVGQHPGRPIPGRHLFST